MHSLLPKTDASEGGAAHGRLDTVRAYVVVRSALTSAVTDASRAHQEAKGLRTGARSQAKSMYVAAATQLVKKAPSRDAMGRARSNRSIERVLWRQPVDGNSGSAQIALDELLSGTRSRDPANLLSAPVPELTITSLCFADGRCQHQRKKTRGRQSYLKCDSCHVLFHSSCVKAAGLSQDNVFYCDQGACVAPDAAVVAPDASSVEDDWDDAVPLVVRRCLCYLVLIVLSLT